MFVADGSEISITGAGVDSHPQVGLEARHHRRHIVDDQADLADRQQAGRSERRGSGIRQRVPGDQFDDIAIWIVAVDGVRIPAGEGKLVPAVAVPDERRPRG